LLAHQLCRANVEFMNTVGRQLAEAGFLKEEQSAAGPPTPRYGECRRRRAQLDRPDDDE
jgi:hypothetical protein